MKIHRDFILYLAMFSFIFIALLPSAAAAQKNIQQIPGVYMEEWDSEPEEQGEVETAQASQASQATQATLNSLFGNGKKIAIPPQIAGGTVALPSFDSGDLEIEEMKAED